jgi:PAS domain S-box-containing protein
MDQAAPPASRDVAIVLADSAGTIRYWNEAAHAFFGYDAAAIVGQRVSLLVPPQYRDRHERGFAEAVSTGATRSGVRRGRRPGFRCCAPTDRFAGSRGVRSS